MFPFRSENNFHLSAHNIHIKRLETPMMSQPQPRKVLHLPKVRMLSRGGKITSGVRITNVKSIRPLNPEIAKQHEENKLRAQLQKEIVSRSRQCAYTNYECWQPVVTGRQHCAVHITREPGAPYIQCSHVSQGERCQLPAPADHPPELCFEHARLALLARQRTGAPPPPVNTTETLLTQLQHYVKTERPRTTSCASSVSVVSDPSEPEQLSPVAVDPFKQMDATTINLSYSTSILECGSESDSEGDDITLGASGNCRYTRPASDTEDAPTEDEPLWHAGVFTAEEAVRETKTVLRSLQAAYIRQMGRLTQLLQTARLKYLQNLKKEKEQYCSINSQARSSGLTPHERRQLKKLKAYAGYHHTHGTHALLARKLHKRRAKVNDCHTNRPLPSAARCTFSEGGVRCGSHVVPASKHCLKHILHDRHQVLFKPCGDVRGVDTCREPVARSPLPSLTCRYHTDPPQYTVFTLKKDDSDTETDSQISHNSDGSQTPDHSEERTDTAECTEPLPSDPLQYE